MSFVKEIQYQLQRSADLMTALKEQESERIAQAAEIMINTLQAGNKILFCGNGGSAADAQHLAAELVGRFLINRRAYAAVALTTDTSILTAVANDFGYETVFSRQVEALGEAGDCLVALTTSGRSKNVALALKTAGARGLRSVVLVGAEETPETQCADVVLRFPSDETPRIQEGHGAVGHILCDLVEKAMVQHDNQD